MGYETSGAVQRSSSSIADVATQTAKNLLAIRETMTEPLTLHTAIERVLADAGRSLTTREIADAVKEQRLHARGDGQPVPASQIGARIQKYPALFTKVGNQKSLGDNDGPPPLIAPKN